MNGLPLLGSTYGTRMNKSYQMDKINSNDSTLTIETFTNLFDDILTNGFPKFSNTDKNISLILGRFIYDGFELDVPCDVIKIIMRMSSIDQYIIANGSYSYDCLKLKGSNKKYGYFLYFDNNWYQILPEPCTARFGSTNDSNGFTKCLNITASPGNGDIHLGGAQNSCCIKHVAGLNRISVYGDTFGCRACFECVARVRNGNYNSKSIHCAVDLDGIRLTDIDREHKYNYGIGNKQLYKQFKKNGFVRKEYRRISFCWTAKVIRSGDTIVKSKPNVKHLIALRKAKCKISN